MKTLIIAACLFSTAVFAADKPKPWTAMTVYGDGHLLINENIESEHVCREALCMTKNNMTCEDKEAADVKAAADQKKAEDAYEKRKAEYRIDHPCVPKMDDWGDGKKRQVFHCPLPNGGEEDYYDSEDGKHTMVMGAQAFGTWTRTISGASGPSITKQVCFQ
jgi:hypothetical protein